MISVRLAKLENVVKSKVKVSGKSGLRLLAVALLAASSAPSHAFVTSSMSCSLNGATRTVFIQLEDPAAAVPCEVMQNKNPKSEDSAVSLWSAGDDPMYCQTKLDGYIDKLRDLGFECW